MSRHKRIFYINSRDRTSGTNSDFTYDIDLKGLDVSHAAILQAYIPKSFYVVVSGENTFTLEEDSKQASVSISPGSYSKSSLKSHLQTQLNSASPNGYSYTITTPSSSQGETGKLTFSVSGNGGIQPILIFTTYLWEQLGFDKNSSNQFSSDTLTSTNVINLQSENTIFLHSDIIQDSDSVLQEIYAGSSLNYSAISFQNHSPELYAKKLQTADSNSYRFYLTDENSNPINLNGLNIVLTLLVYKPIDWRVALGAIISQLLTMK